MSQDAFTAEDFRQAGLGDHFRRIIDLARLFADFNLETLTELVDALRAVLAAKTLPEQVRTSLAVLSKLASLTENTTDDRIVRALQAILTEDLLEVISRLIEGFRGSQTAESVEQHLAADHQTAADHNIPWEFLVQLALAISEMLNRLQSGEAAA